MKLFERLAPATAQKQPSPAPAPRPSRPGRIDAARLAAHLAVLSRQSPDADPVQRREAAPAPRRNETGLPDRLKAGVEALSGLSLDDVRVHFGSAKPAQLQAHAFTKGSEIHVAPGQERHLAHEAWHVVQQKQGRVRATMQMKGLEINEDPALEQEADAMDERAGNAAPDVQEHVLGDAGPSADGKVHQLARAPRPQREAVRNQYGARSRYGRPLHMGAEMPLALMELGNALNTAFRAAGGVPGVARHYVYLATQGGRVVYVGITNDVAARQAEHGDRFHLHQLNRARLNRIQVRAIEQFAINQFRRHPNNQNIANSIAVRHPYYRPAMRYGQAFHAWVSDQIRYLRV